MSMKAQATARQARTNDAHALDVIAELLSIFHYDPVTGCWQTEVIRDGTRATLGNMEMKPITPRAYDAILHAKAVLGQAMTGEKPRDWWELEGG